MANRDQFDDDEGFIDSLLRRKGQEPMPPSMARLLMIVAGLAVVITIIAVAVATWPRHGGGPVDESNLPVVRADQSEYRVKPDEPGGMDVPNKNSTIFETISKEDDGSKKIENLLEDQETPVKKEEVFAKEEPIPSTQGAVDASDQNKENVASEERIEVKETPKADQKKEEPVVAKTETKPAVVKEDVKSAEKQDIISTLKSEVGTAKAASGTVYIQLAAVKSEADAKTKWGKLQSQFGALKSLSYRVQKADVAGKGTFFRVQAGPMSADAAKSTCASVKAAKGDCLVVK